MSTPAPTAKPQSAPARRSLLWLLFVAAFAVQLVVWTVWFVIASHHPVAEVPLVTNPAR